MSQIFNSNDYLDVYAPKMNSDPIGFCQMGESFAFGMTDLTYDGPVIKYTSLNEEIVSVTRNGKITGLKEGKTKFVPERFDNRCIAVKLNEIYKKINQNFVSKSSQKIQQKLL